MINVMDVLVVGCRWTAENCFRRILEDEEVDFRINSFPVSQFAAVDAKGDLFW